MPQPYWPPGHAHIELYESALKRVQAEDIWDVLRLHPLQLEDISFGRRDPIQDDRYRSRSTRVEGLASDGRRLELVLRPDRRVDHERCHSVPRPLSVKLTARGLWTTGGVSSPMLPVECLAGQISPTQSRERSTAIRQRAYRVWRSSSDICGDHRRASRQLRRRSSRWVQKPSASPAP